MDTSMTRRSFGWLLAGTALGGRLTLGNVFAPDPSVTTDGRSPNFFPYGTHVYREPTWPLEQLRSDLPLLKRLGFNMVKVQESWSIDEKREGEIDLSRVAAVVSDARDQGLQVYFGVTMEQVPAWLWKKYPDARLVYESGLPDNSETEYLFPADGKPGPCWHHPDARAAGIRFVERVGREIGKYDNIQVWNVWQEIAFWPTVSNQGGVCYCPNTLQRYREWLRARYKTLDNLNRTWWSGFGEWEAIEPPRHYSMIPPSIDWRYFMNDVYFSEALRWKVEAFRRSDPHSRPVLAHVSEPEIGNTTDWHYSEVLDIYGSSCYPNWWTKFNAWDADAPSAGKPVAKHVGLERELWDDVMLRFDYIRCASRHGVFWTAELQGGRGVEGLTIGRTPDVADIRRWVLGCLAAGSRGICFWNHRADIFWAEGYGYGLLDARGDSTPRAVEAGRLGKALQAHADLFVKGSTPPAEVAIVMNGDLWNFCAGSPFAASEHLAYTIRGMYKALWDKGVPVDFVDVEQISNPPYRVMIAPFPVALSSKVIDAFREYVRGGGVLISEACPGRFDSYGFGFPGEMAPGIAELFGASHKQLVMVREPEDGEKWTAAGRTFGDTTPFRYLTGAGEFSTHKLFPARYVQTVTPTAARPVLMDGNEVAGCVNQFGKGRAFLIGTMMGHGVTSYRNRGNGAFLAALLAHAGVQPDLVGRLQRRRRVLDNKTAWFLFNTSDVSIEARIETQGFKSVADLLNGPLVVDNAKASLLKVDPMDIRCVVLES